jgi:hypothetical protein
VSRRLVIALAVLVAVLAVAQVVLPALAERHVRGRLERVGKVEAVQVRAFPAVKLLWRRADRVEVAMTHAAARPSQWAELLAGARGVARLRAEVDRLRVGPLTVRDTNLVKQGAQLTGQAFLTREALRAAVPPGMDVQPMASPAGQLAFAVTAAILGRTVRFHAVARAVGGRLVVAPAAPLAGLFTLTVFSDRRVLVEEVGGRPRPGGLAVAARARLRG